MTELHPQRVTPSYLHGFRYNPWPYKGYRGLLPEGDERVLYQNARVCPAISEPHAETTGDIVERVYKVMGSGGLAITDVAPFYSDLFEPDELLVPGNLDEYHDMVHQALTDDDFNRCYREKGYRAILERHTYAHRVRTILDYLGIHLEQAQEEKTNQSSVIRLFAEEKRDHRTK